ncbi:MAG TPA: hypothetical protein PKD09_00690 [Aggregatilinea sp.]|jgi:hypothetical protein|uniref:hypothetical protein n=1 Tax=Aggregatilinea sp. TaxID=2806333 RepID=UPI002BB805A2|nr:hypothetical protein [Aggregatilinea sp.]HML20133.1 hypothetical protein [Aggregatilinea sp.]
MLDQHSGQGIFSIAEVYRLRVEAMHLYEHCLTTGDDTSFISFIEAQIVENPPRLLVMHGIADDLEQRLLSLRAHHFDVRERVMQALRDGYDLDMQDLSPNEEKTDALPDAPLLHQMIVASTEAEESLQTDIQTTLRLHHLVLDWLEGMSAVSIRQHWISLTPANTGTILH